MTVMSGVSWSMKASNELKREELRFRRKSGKEERTPVFSCLQILCVINVPETVTPGLDYTVTRDAVAWKISEQPIISIDERKPTIFVAAPSVGHVDRKHVTRVFVYHKMIGGKITKLIV